MRVEARLGRQVAGYRCVRYRFAANNYNKRKPNEIPHVSHKARQSSKGFRRMAGTRTLNVVAFAIAASVVSSVARAAAPPQQCPTGTILNLQTHACDPAKPPSAPASSPVIKDPVGHPAINDKPGKPVCPENAATCLPGTATPQTCAPGYYGAGCYVCPGGATHSCSSKGTCSQGINGSGACSCVTGFAGPICQYSDASTCNGHGSASDTGSCTCQTGYSGPSCK
jgi:hypothetical protein